MLVPLYTGNKILCLMSYVLYNHCSSFPSLFLLKFYSSFAFSSFPVSFPSNYYCSKLCYLCLTYVFFFCCSARFCSLCIVLVHAQGSVPCVSSFFFLVKVLFRVSSLLQCLFFLPLLWFFSGFIPNFVPCSCLRFCYLSLVFNTVKYFVRSFLLFSP